MAKVKRTDGIINIKISQNTIIDAHYSVESDEGILYDNDGGGLPSYSAINIERVFCNDCDITSLVEQFEPLHEYIIDKIRDTDE